MDPISTEVVALLKYLLPGFLSAWIFYGFTSFKKPSHFERVVQALIFTLIVQLMTIGIKTALTSIQLSATTISWGEGLELATSVLCATVLGFTFAAFANNDAVHHVVRWLGISKETSYPSEWYGEFSKNVTYVVLHLKDGRRIYGWPREWPTSPSEGHFSLNQASWLLDAEEPEEPEEPETSNTVKSLEIPLERVEAILIPAEDVAIVEFMKKTWENQNE